MWDVRRRGCIWWYRVSVVPWSIGLVSGTDAVRVEVYEDFRTPPRPQLRAPSRVSGGREHVEDRAGRCAGYGSQLGGAEAKRPYAYKSECIGAPCRDEEHGQSSYAGLFASPGPETRLRAMCGGVCKARQTRR